MYREFHINIISFDVPHPPDYGGVIDVFYKIKALHEAGIKIHLHCFQYGRSESPELKLYCEDVYYYKRRFAFNPLYTSKPFIIASRRSKSLLNNLMQNNYPIFFEGLHTTYYLNRPELKNRLKIVRMHNIEYIYYMHLAKVEKSPFRRYYYAFEADRLKKYQYNLNNASKLAAISHSDQQILHLKHHYSFYLPVFHANEQVISASGKGKFILYHGNLGVGENNEAALFLARNVFGKISHQVIIAGSNPSLQLVNECANLNNVTLVNPCTDEIYALISEAHINILPTFQDTGIKLKLLNALFKGRFCIVNSKMVKETGLEHLCILAESSDDFIHAIEDCFGKGFNVEEVKQREKVLMQLFDNRKSAMLLIEQFESQALAND